MQHVSQFPNEVEFTFPPLSYIQPEFLDGRHRIEYCVHPERKSIQVPVIYVRVNANIRSPNLDEVNSARKKDHMAAFRSQNRDTAAEIRGLCNKRKEVFLRRLRCSWISGLSHQEKRRCRVSNLSDDREDETLYEGFQLVISDQCQDVLKTHEELREEVFADKLEHSRLVTEMISVRKWAIAKLLWFIEDEGLGTAMYRVLRYPLPESYREYVTFCRSRIKKSVDRKEKSKSAIKLCQLIGLLGSNVHDRSAIDSAIILAVVNGACNQDIELMLDTGLFEINSILTPSGNSLLATAVRYGFIEMARLLIKRGADVEFQNAKDGRTPMMLALGHGHEDCVKLLLRHTSPCSPTGNKTDTITPFKAEIQVTGFWAQQYILFKRCIICRSKAAIRLRTSLPFTQFRNQIAVMLKAAEFCRARIAGLEALAKLGFKTEYLRRMYPSTGVPGAIFDACSRKQQVQILCFGCTMPNLCVRLTRQPGPRSIKNRNFRKLVTSTIMLRFVSVYSWRISRPFR